MTEKEKFEHWLKTNGVLDIKFSLAEDFDSTKYSSKEEALEAIYTELNAINAAIDSGNVTVFEDY